MEIYGLNLTGLVSVPERKNWQNATEYKTFALGGGDWSIEVYSDDELLAEFVGSNGTREGEEGDDLWAEVEEWKERVARPAYSYKEYEAPDGKRGSYNYFVHEALKGRLHGCVVAF